MVLQDRLYCNMTINLYLPYCPWRVPWYDVQLPVLPDAGGLPSIASNGHLKPPPTTQNLSKIQILIQNVNIDTENILIYFFADSSKSNQG